MSKEANESHLKNIVAHCKEYGFVFPSSEIYDGLSAVYDYGPFGAELKNNIKEYWWRSMTRMHQNIVGIDTAIFMHPTTWKASGHLEAFSDPLIDNKDSKKRYRADVLIEDYLAKVQGKIDKEVHKAGKRLGDDFDKQRFLETQPRVVAYQEKKKNIENRFKESIASGDLADLKLLIEELEIADPVSGSRNWTDVRQFNLMFSTSIGSLSEGADTIYLRPETAQGIFVNFLNVQKTARMKLPFGIAQIGKAFRNEIIARQFVFRMREFEQMEMQFFVEPGSEKKWYDYWKETRMKWHTQLGIGEDKYQFHDHINLAHYANAACDIEFKFPMGFKELEGIHSRTDFDLKSHEQHSGKKMQYFDTQSQKSFTPYVVETSIGLDRMFLAVLSAAFVQEKLEDGSIRTVLKLPPALSPVKAAILPLVNKEELLSLSNRLLEDLQVKFSVQTESKDTIGKRYRRQDAIGTPYCITIDGDSLAEETVTIRDRDTMQQERVAITNVANYLNAKTDLTTILKK